ncbi:MAG: hypothetical protein SGI74_01220 [Oligoflexia bacterium]|nr:hypothetical protein [Oligoflexia bacterium]
MGNKGQSLILFLVLFPVLLTISGVIVRSGQSALILTQSENLCSQIALDTLAEQAKGIETLGKLNPYAKQIIDMKREVELLILAATTQPQFLPALIQARKTLIASQKIIAINQQNIKRQALARSFARINKQLPKKYRGKLLFRWNPAMPLILLNQKLGYENETGAPLELPFDFELRSKLIGTGKLETEKFLLPWQNADGEKFKKYSSLSLTCNAYIKMKGIGEPWEVLLTKDKPSLKLL